MKTVWYVATAALCLALNPVAAGASTIQSFQIAGTTTGCFGAGCSTFLDQSSSGAFSFDGLAFEITTDDTGSATFNLGTFSRGNANVTDTLPFTLLVEFTAPGHVAPGSSYHLGTLALSVSASGAGPVWVDFDNDFKHFAFLGGSFSFGILDIGHSSNGSGGITRNGSQNLVGVIRLAQTIAGDDPNPVSDPLQVPEPASVLLLGMGLLFAGLRARSNRR